MTAEMMLKSLLEWFLTSLAMGDRLLLSFFPYRH